VLETLSQYPNAGRQREAQFSYSRQGLPLTEARAGQSARCKRSELTGEEVRYLWDGDSVISSKAHYNSAATGFGGAGNCWGSITRKGNCIGNRPKPVCGASG